MVNTANCVNRSCEPLRILETQLFETAMRSITRLLRAIIFTIVLPAVDLPAQITLDLIAAPSRPEIFAEGIVSTSVNERDFAISPDGREVYFTITSPQSTFQTIVFMRKEGNAWTKPQITSFAGNYSDLEPAFSPDGRKMYFASNRPISGNKPKDFDIWVVERAGSVWGEPKNLGTPVNTSADEFYPSITKNGNLYFTAQYEGGVGKEDIYFSSLSGSAYTAPVALDTAVNSTFYEFNAFVEPDEKFIIFSSFGRNDDTGRGDLYISTKGESGKWTKARNLKMVNSNRLDYCPYVSADRKIFFFTSERSALPLSFDIRTSYEEISRISGSALNGTGNIYWMQFDSLKD